VLEAGEELRLEVDDNVVTVTLETGLAEIFGAEVPRGESLKLFKTKLAVRLLSFTPPPPTHPRALLRYGGRIAGALVTVHRCDARALTAKE
jgi:hypothetical protein